jgi:hypothetical protein
VNHYEAGRLVSLGTTFTISLILVFGSVLLSLSVMNVALAVDMPDAPVTQDTVTTGNDENDDNEADEGNDQSDNLPDPEDAPVTTETTTSGENEGSKEDKSNDENNDKDVENENDIDITPRQSCSRYQERSLFLGTCLPMPPILGDSDEADNPNVFK